ncbi:MAG: hypothetical protein WBF67_01875 [Olleya sp.]
MKRFLKHIIFFLIPFLIYAALVLSLDIFKIFNDYDNYYDSDITTLNRTFVSTKIYLKHKDSMQYNAFIFGSSRSQAFKTDKWKQYLLNGVVPFHYDAHSEDLYGIFKKIEFLDAQQTNIKHALVVIDRSTLAGIKKRDHHLYINPLEFNDVSKFEFYSSYIKANLNPRFMIAYTDFSINKKHRGYMKTLVREDKYPDSFIPIYNDSYYGMAREIEEDSLGYYKKLLERNVFYKRPGVSKVDLVKTDNEVQLLINIKSIFNKHQTGYKIVISPLYDQIPMEDEQLQLLHTIFGQENIFDFSGKNKFTEPISNYFESSHYKPSVANTILDSIY